VHPPWVDAAPPVATAMVASMATIAANPTSDPFIDRMTKNPL